MLYIWVATIGLGVGFLGGLLGKGGSAIATPLLHAVGLPAIVAVAAPLPATIPATSAAGSVYWRRHLVDRRVVAWSLACGAPATALGALATRWIDGAALVVVTDVVLIALGIRLLWPHRDASTGGEGAAESAPAHPAGVGERLSGPWLASVAIVVGAVAGLLANSGGFLLAPLYMTVLRLPIKRALGSSLAVAAVLAIPGSLVHIALGHVDWGVVGVFGLTSIPLSMMGARVALRIDGHRLERGYGAALVVLGAVFVTIG